MVGDRIGHDFMQTSKWSRMGLRLAVLVSAIVVGWSAVNARADEPTPVVEPEPGLLAAVEQTLSGRVYVWDEGRLRPAAHAHVTTGKAAIRTDSNGRFEFTAEERSNDLAVIRPGYDVVRRPVYFDETVIVLRDLVVRAIYIPFGEVTSPSVQRWVHELVDADLINSIVFDLKHEGGQVFSVAATPTVEQIGAAIYAENLAPFLAALEEKGVYRIGRVVTFLDPWYASWFPEHALHNLSGGLFQSKIGAWASAYSWSARRYNIDIGIAAAEHVDEIQYDYVRLPYEDGLLQRYGESARVDAINAFAQEASEALHLAGLALSFDTFGVVSTAGNDQGIGQSVAGVAPHLDYISPMVYPSGWGEGSFGFDYPPAHPFEIVRRNVGATVDLITDPGSALVRPWLQDFHDYRGRGLTYNAWMVSQQIEATAEAGGFGFMLWDPALTYERVALQQAIELTWSPLS